MTGDQADAIFSDLTAGIPLRKSLAAKGIDPTTFYRAINADEALCQRYTRAKSDGMDAIADSALEISDNVDADQAAVAKAKLQVETRKWFLAKLAPKKYGERMLVGSDPDNPIPPLVVIGPTAKPGDGSVDDQG